MEQDTRYRSRGQIGQNSDGKNAYTTVDIDGFFILITPGAASPYPGGLLFDQVCNIIFGVANKGCIIATNLVGVSPACAPSGSTVRFGALPLLHIMSRIEIDDFGIELADGNFFVGYAG